MTKIPSVPAEPTHSRGKDQMFQAFSEQRRRFTLRVLRQHQEATVSELAKEVAAREDDGTNSNDISNAVTEVCTDLYHRHIPILAEAGLVHTVEEQDVVAISKHGMNATAYLEGTV